MSPLSNVTVVGATGAVGQEMVRCLGEDRFAPASLRLFGSPRSAGTLVPFRGGEILVEDSDRLMTSWEFFMDCCFEFSLRSLLVLQSESI